MSFFVRNVSFWQQNQAWRARQKDNNGSQADAAMAAGTTALTSIGNAVLNKVEQSGILAARIGVAAVAKQAEAKLAKLSRNAGDLNGQVTFTGSLSGVVDFGADGPSAIGGFRFVAGSDLKTAFKQAMIGIFSNGSAVDTVSVTGNTLTASTSGLDAHPVFTMTLKPDSGAWTFKLLNPIDGKPLAKDSDLITFINVSGFMQGVKSTGATVALPNNVTVNIYGDIARAGGKPTVGEVHQGALPYTPPEKIVKPVEVIKPEPYVPPVNPATGKQYVATTSSSVGSLTNFLS